MINNFSDLMEATQKQAEPQRLLFLFAKAEREEHADRGQKGTISPVMVVDKLPEEIAGFDKLVTEADMLTKDWNFIFIGALSGENGASPSTAEAQPHLEEMAKSLETGQGLSRYMLLDRENKVISLRAA